jgi:hypothetical protein
LSTKERLRIAREHHQSLQQGTFTSANEEAIQNEIEAITASLRDELAQVRKQMEDHRLAEKEHSTKLAGLKQDLDQARADLEQFKAGSVPITYVHQHDGALTDAKVVLDAEICSADAKITKANEEMVQSSRSIDQLASRIGADHARQIELDGVSTQGIWSKLRSPSWWGSFGTDYKKRIAQSQHELDSLRRQLLDIEIRIAQARADHGDLVASRELRGRPRFFAGATKTRWALRTALSVCAPMRQRGCPG